MICCDPLFWTDKSLLSDTSEVNRDLSIHFSRRFFNGLNHTEILDAVKSVVSRDNINAIQLTEKNCVVSMKEKSQKDLLLSVGITIWDRSVSFVDVDKQLTNVTIKDIPYEISDTFIATNMTKFGQVIEGSFKRGVIKYTNIENGTRYLQLLDCVPVLPVACS